MQADGISTPTSMVMNRPAAAKRFADGFVCESGGNTREKKRFFPAGSSGSSSSSSSSSTAPSAARRALRDAAMRMTMFLPSEKWLFSVQ